MLHCRFSLVLCTFLIGLYFVDFLTTCGSTQAQLNYISSECNDCRHEYAQKSLTNIKSKRRKKFLASRFRYYPNSDASFNVERNPGPSNGSKSSSITPSKQHESLTFIMQNVRSLKSFQLDNLTNCRENKLSCFQDIVLLNQFDVIALTETWLNNSITDYEVIPNGYQIFRKDRSTGKRGGGVLLAVKDSISTEPFIFNCESNVFLLLCVIDHLTLIVTSFTT